MNVLDGKGHRKNRASFGEELNINDYSEDDTLSNQNSQGSDDLPLEEIEQILCEEGHVLSQKETILIAKINHLQNKCNRLTLSNYELARQIEDFEGDSLALSEVEINESMANQFLEVMEREIAAYKQQFGQYRNHQNNALRAKEEEVQKLKATIQDLKLANDCLEESRDNAVDENDEMSKLNEELVIQIERLEDQFTQINSHNSSMFTAYPADSSGYFEGQVQDKLEALIQKLMKQLKAERVHKKRMNEQIKIMQQEILDLERQLSAKNQQIIEIQMCYLKSNRTTPFNLHKNQEISMHRTRTFTGPNFQQQHHRPQNATVKQTPNSVVFKPFSLASLLNNEEQTNSRERMVIAGKIIDFYLKKIANHDLATLDLQNIVICNFSHRNPRLCLVRKGQSNIRDQQEGTQQLLIQNLCGALSALFNQKRSATQIRTKCEKETMIIVARMLKSKDYSLPGVQEMKQIIVEGLRGQV